MGDMSHSSFRVFFARQLQQLVLLFIICGILFGSFHTFTSRPPQLIISSGQFPRKIWQSWKVDPTRFEHRDNERARTWTVKNPSHRYEVLTDDNAEFYVEHHFGPLGLNRPDIVNVYKSLNAKIIKSDLLRYLIMYIEGGVYADIDVEAIRPIKRFIPKAFDEADIDMVIGIEVDEPDFAFHPVLGSKAQSFCQWTFVCKPRLPVMLRLIENIMKWLHELSVKQGKPISDLYLDFNEVLSGTGPSAFTIAILAEMSKTVGKPVVWDTFHGLTEPKLVGAVLVLTVEAFAAGTGHSDSGNHGGKGAMVKHHFHASSWPSNHPRFKHPVYGEVEKCNWNMECVKLWDANAAFFDALPEMERLKIISLKEAKDQKKADPAPAPAPAPALAPIAVAPEQLLLGPADAPARMDIKHEQAGPAIDLMTDQPEVEPVFGPTENGDHQVNENSNHEQLAMAPDSRAEHDKEDAQHPMNVHSEQPTEQDSLAEAAIADVFATTDDSSTPLEARAAVPEGHEAAIDAGLTPGLAL
jgi:mannosyltransferase OCH1-like enzyme